jgi:hypothetical protein
VWWRGGAGGRRGGGGSARSGAGGLIAIIVAHTILHAHCVVSIPRIGADSSIGILGAIHIAVLAVAALVDLVKNGNHKAKNGDGHDQLDDASDEEQHSGLCAGGGGGALF